MFSLLWKLLEAAIGIAVILSAGMLLSAIMDFGVFGGLAVLVFDVALLFFCDLEMDLAELFAFEEIAHVLHKVVEEAIIFADEDDAQRHARHAALVRWHGNKVYLFGDVSIEDAATLWFAGRELEGSELAASVFGVTADEMTVIL